MIASRRRKSIAIEMNVLQRAYGKVNVCCRSVQGPPLCVSARTYREDRLHGLGAQPVLADSEQVRGQPTVEIVRTTAIREREFSLILAKVCYVPKTINRYN